jgi:hypothetical protein
MTHISTIEQLASQLNDLKEPISESQLLKKSLSLFRLASDTFCQFGTMYRQTKKKVLFTKCLFKEENFSKLCLDIKSSSTNYPGFSSQPQRPLFRGQR